jgi:sugar lactone lactonase YvrE
MIQNHPFIRNSIPVLSALILGLSLFIPANTQKIETVDGVRVVHNRRDGEWGARSKITIDLIRTIGDINTLDENLAFNRPADLARDESGNIYILDSGNHRIQKFSPDGDYLTTLGRRGQGPVEFNYPQSLELDSKGMIFVLDGFQQRIQILTPEGKEHKTIPVIKFRLDGMQLLKSGRLAVKGYADLESVYQSKEKRLPKVVKLLDMEGTLLQEFGEMHDFGDQMASGLGNLFKFETDSRDNLYLAFIFQNRIEKYSPEGQLLWRADRELNYPMGVLKKGKVESSGGSVSYEAPKMNTCSSSIAVDDNGRVWVATLSRQIKKEEEVYTMMIGGRDGVAKVETKGNVDLQTTDMYKLEIFSPEGILLGEIPLTQFVDDMFIWKDRLFLLDRERGCKFYEYRITERL